jgi:hypothetical protein
MRWFTSALGADNLRPVKGSLLKTTMRWGIGSLLAAALIGCGDVKAMRSPASF